MDYYPFISGTHGSYMPNRACNMADLQIFVEQIFKSMFFGRSTVEQKMNIYSDHQISTICINLAEESLPEILPPTRVTGVSSKFRTEHFGVTDLTLRSPGFTLFILNHKVILDLIEVKPTPAFKRKYLKERKKEESVQ